MSTEEFNRLIRDTLLYDTDFPHDQLSALLKQGAQGDLDAIVHCYQREMTPHRIEELLYFLLSEGVAPDVRTIKTACSKNLHLLEDLLKSYDGPLDIAFVYGEISIEQLSQAAEVASGFGVTLVLKRYTIRDYILSFLFLLFILL